MLFREEPSPGTIRSETDKITGVEGIILDDMRAKLDLGTGVPIIVRIFGVKAGTSASLSFSAVFSDWRWLRCSQLGVRIDGQGKRFEAEHNGTAVTGDRLIETVTWELSEDDLSRLSSARELMIQVCSDEVVLDQAQLLKINAFARGIADTNAQTPRRTR
jgi:hypothetical protein